ncbi:hypothetical protein [Mesorhizobium amorphae]|uniref:hypothetical protein n=1 Tax=Mesorhizobium amorphae TaxID=71433 RepID=UPI0024E191DE|nr:hypothetical protein [Mesorhizobium amorphae]
MPYPSPFFYSAAEANAVITIWAIAILGCFRFALPLRYALRPGGYEANRAFDVMDGHEKIGGAAIGAARHG